MGTVLKLYTSHIPCLRYHLLISSVTETFQITFFIVANLRIRVEYTITLHIKCTSFYVTKIKTIKMHII